MSLLYTVITMHQYGNKSNILETILYQIYYFHNKLEHVVQRNAFVNVVRISILNILMTTLWLLTSVALSHFVLYSSSFQKKLTAHENNLKVRTYM